MPNTCAIPGCHWERKSKEKRSLFTIYRPDLARSDEERRHRRALTQFILHWRDSSKGDNIQHLLHKETAAICNHHFEKDAIIISAAGKRALRCGALPTVNLPQKSHSTKSSVRKPPTDRRHPAPRKRARTSLKAFREANNGVPKNVRELSIITNLKILADMRNKGTAKISAKGKQIKTESNFDNGICNTNNKSVGIGTREFVVSCDFSCQVGESYLKSGGVL